MNEDLLKIVVEFYRTLDRQGPGSDDTTRKALTFMDWHNRDLSILDVGCGTGAQTIVLARASLGKVTAVDLYKEFLEVLDSRIRSLRLEDRVSTLQASMENLPFADHSFDLIWAEGSIYNMGFREGMQAWKRLLKPGGYIAVTEMSWTTGRRPAEISKYWAREYPGIDTVSNKLRQIEDLDYSTLAHFLIPANCWEEHYYKPIFRKLNIFRHEYPEGKVKDDFIAMVEEELQMFRKYSEFYGYVFYIARNN